MRLVDADKVDKVVKPWSEEMDCNAITITDARKLILNTISRMPTVDAVQVVRCKECSVPHNEHTGCPMVYGRIVGPNWFCGDGIRKDGEQDDMGRD